MDWRGCPPWPEDATRKGSASIRRIIIFNDLAAATLPGCAPLLVGAGGALIADKAVENHQGDDGLF